MPMTDLLETTLPRLKAQRQNGNLGSKDYAAAYFLVWQIATHGQRFASRTRRTDKKPNADELLEQILTETGPALRETLTSQFHQYQFLGVLPAVPAAFLGWLEADWPLKLLTTIPAPNDVLKLQAKGSRPVTVLEDYQRARLPVLTKTNGFHFLVHDLEHAYKFFHNPALHQAQRQFFRLMQRAGEKDFFKPYLTDTTFAAQYDYLISDMNTHPVHGFRYLTAVLIECRLRQEGKTVKESLSVSSENELAEFFDTLGDNWQFQKQATAALKSLLKGHFGTTEAQLLEQAVLGAGVPS